MKSIRKTTAKTRKGILTWLTKLNPANLSVPSNATAIYVHRHTGRLHGYDRSDGIFVNLHKYFSFPSVVTRAA